jgi:spoIIIJ-associated protein
MNANPKEILDTLLGYLGFVCEIEEERNEAGLVLQVHTHDAQHLLGAHGEGLEQLQFLLNRLLQSEDRETPRVQVDIEHYRDMRRDELVQRARHAADSVRATGQPVQLEPMNSYQRRLVHDAFKDDAEVMSVSPSDDARLKRITLQRRIAKG